MNSLSDLIPSTSKQFLLPVMLNEDKCKQNKHDNLTRKERIALRGLIKNPHIVTNKADKSSTIVVRLY